MSTWLKAIVLMAGLAVFISIEAGAMGISTQAPPFELSDQFGKPHSYAFPRPRVSVLVFADRKGSDQLEAWVKPMYERYPDAIDIHGVAKLQGVPGFMKPVVRALFRRGVKYPVMLDWTGTVSTQYAYEARVSNVLVIGPDGGILHRVNGAASEEGLSQCFNRIDRCLRKAGAAQP